MLYYCCCHHQFVVILICILYLVVVLIFFINIFIADSNNDYDADHLKHFDDDNYHSHNHHHHNHYHEPHSPRDMKSTNPQKPSNQPQVETDFYYYFNHVFWFTFDIYIAKRISLTPNTYIYTRTYMCVRMYVLWCTIRIALLSNSESALCWSLGCIRLNLFNN